MPARRSALLATLLLVGSIAGPGLAASPGSAADGDVAFERDSFETHRGGTVAIPVSVPDGATTRVYVQWTTDAVTSSVTVADDGDGRVVVVLNTYTGDWSVRGRGDAIERERPADRSPLRPRRYEVTATAGDSGASATLDVRPRPLTGLRTWYGENVSAPFENASAVEAAIDAGALTPAERVRENGTLVFEVDAPGLSGVLAATPGRTLTARFRRAVRQHGAFAVVQSNPTPELQPVTLAVLNASSTRVLADAANGTYFVVADLSETPVLRGDRRVASVEYERLKFEANAVLATHSNLTESRHVETAFVGPRRADVVTASDDRVHLFPADKQAVSGYTTVGTARNVTVVVRGVDDPSTAANESFVRRTQARVRHAPDRYVGNRFTATLNLTGAPATRVAVDVRAGNESLLDGPVPGRVAPSKARLEVEAVVPATTPRVQVAVELFRGGFVVLHERTADGPVVGASTYVDPGEHTVSAYVDRPTNASTLVAVVHVDENHNEWFDGPSVDGPLSDGENAVATVTLPDHATTTPGTETTTTGTSPASSTPTTEVPVPAPGVLLAALGVLAGLAVAFAARSGD